MKNNFFKVSHYSKRSKARIGEIKTGHGVIKTPAFMAAGTKGTIKALPTQFIKPAFAKASAGEDIGIQVAFVNTYHLVTHPGVEVIEKAGGIHKFANLNIPLMSDSGGFQVFSLARNQREKLSLRALAKQSQKEIASSLISSPPRDDRRIANIRGDPSSSRLDRDFGGAGEQPLVVKISDDGVKFRSTYDGRLVEFTPEKSMKYQRKIGADLMMAFDECITYGSSYDYSKKATERTHRWLERCIAEKRKWKTGMEAGQVNGSRNRKLEKKEVPTSIHQLPNPPPNPTSNFQFLYGVIQGATYEDLRKKSAEFVVSQPVDGIAIGGISVGESKKEMRDQVGWVSDYLPKDKPVHLLGVGQFDDILDLVKYGIDTFDCVEPTRLARMGKIYQSIEADKRGYQRGKTRNSASSVNPRSHRRQSASNEIDIFKTIYKKNLESVDENCDCYVCANFTKAYLHHLFKQKEILGYTLATFHNLWVMERFFDRIRELIKYNQI